MCKKKKDVIEIGIDSREFVQNLNYLRGFFFFLQLQICPSMNVSSRGSPLINGSVINYKCVGKCSHLVGKLDGCENLTIEYFRVLGCFFRDVNLWPLLWYYSVIIYFIVCLFLSDVQWMQAAHDCPLGYKKRFYSILF